MNILNFYINWIKIKRFLRSMILIHLCKECHTSVRFDKIGQVIGLKYVSIGAESFLGSSFYLTVWHNRINDKSNVECIIGKQCHFGAYNHISVANKVIINDGFLSGKWVTITDNSHGNTDKNSLLYSPMERPITSKGPVIIGKNVWVGDKATILPGVTIGDGAIIAANALVTKDVPPYSVVAGIPAKVLKKY